MTEALPPSHRKPGLRNLIQQVRKLVRFLGATDLEHEVNGVIARFDARQRNFETALDELLTELDGIKAELAARYHGTDAAPENRPPGDVTSQDGAPKQSTVSERWRELVEERVAMIRDAALENLLSAAWLEHELLPQLGLHWWAQEFLPACLGPYCGTGLQSFQAPNQFAKYLAHLSGQQISSYLELGLGCGGTFIITIEYLSRFSAVPVTALGVDISIDPILRAYAELNSNAQLLESSTDTPDIGKLLRRRFWDLALIDADHTEEACERDLALVRDNARLIALHDIYNDICPDIEIEWNRLLRIVPRRSSWEFTEQYEEMLRTRNQRLWGIGLVEWPSRHSG